MSTIPAPGDLAPGFTQERDQCWRMVYAAKNMQGTHCTDRTTHRGRFKNDDQRWDVWACPQHLDELVNVQPVRRAA
jgi:hypothetical protein